MMLATVHKRLSTIAEFFSRMKTLADDMASAGKKLEVEEIASFILAEPLSLGELYTQLVTWEVGAVN